VCNRGTAHFCAEERTFVPIDQQYVQITLISAMHVTLSGDFTKFILSYSTTETWTKENYFVPIVAKITSNLLGVCRNTSNLPTTVARNKLIRRTMIATKGVYAAHETITFGQN
jgi:hypothetical protein